MKFRSLLTSIRNWFVDPAYDAQQLAYDEAQDSFFLTGQSPSFFRDVAEFRAELQKLRADLTVPTLDEHWAVL